MREVETAVPGGAAVFDLRGGVCGAVRGRRVRVGCALPGGRVASCFGGERRGEVECGVYFAAPVGRADVRGGLPDARPFHDGRADYRAAPRVIICDTSSEVTGCKSMCDLRHGLDGRRIAE